MNFRLFRLSLLLVLLYPAMTFSQDSLSVEDTAEINYRAQLVISEFNDLLNIVSNSSVETKQSRDVIFNSHTGNENKIFTDSSVIVEDDISPAEHGSENSKEFTISKYLKDLDLFYLKSDTPSINFFNIRLSSIKKAEYLYVKVYYTSLFTNKNSINEKPYDANNRVAEIKMEKRGANWTGYIIHIGFYNPDRISTDTINDFKAVYKDINNINLRTGTVGSSETLVAQKNTEEGNAGNERQKPIDLLNIDRRKYIDLVERGDAFFRSNDFVSASRMYAEAQEIMPYEIYPKLKLNQIDKLADQKVVSSPQLYKQMIASAQIAEYSRKYEAAKELYLNAVSLRPEEKNTWEAHIKELNIKIRTISVFEERFNAGQYADAISDYDKAIKTDASNSDYFLGRGMCYDKLNDFDNALKDYSRSIDLDNNNLEAIRLRAELYERYNDPIKALGDYKIYITLDKTNIRIFEARSNLHFFMKNIKSATDDLDQGIEFNPKASELYYKRGLLFQSSSDHKDAIEDFTIAVRLDPDSAVYYFSRGKSELDINLVETSSRDFALSRTKGLDQANLKNIDLFAKSFAEMAETDLIKKQIDSAIHFFQNAILVNPFSDLFRLRKGDCYFLKNDFRSAIRFYDEALVLNKNDEEAFYKRGIADFELKDYHQSVLDFDSALLQNPKDYRAERYLGEAHYGLLNFRNAITHFKNAIRLIDNLKSNYDQNDFAIIQNALGKAYYEIYDYENAFFYFKLATKYNKDFAEAYYNRGRANFALNDPLFATEDVLKALSFENRTEWNNALGEIYKARKDLRLAIRYFSNAISNDPSFSFPNSIRNRGDCFFQLKDFTNAISDYQKCISIHYDTLKGFYDELGTIYLNMGNADSAYKYYHLSISYDSADANASYGLGIALFLKGNLDESLLWFEKAFQKGQISYSRIKHDKYLDGIRENKKFDELVKKYIH